MNERLMQFRIGMFVIVAGLVLTMMIVWFGESPTLLRDRVYIKVRFIEAPGVRAGVPVRKSGIHIGEVFSAGFDDRPGQPDGVLLTLALERQYPIRNGAVPRISRTLIGDLSIDMLPGAGDEMQGLKKGVVEIADMIAINKADGDNVARAKAAAAEYRAALHILSPRSTSWSPPVVTYSALTGAGIGDLWAAILDHRKRMTASGELEARRREQQVKWMWALIEERLRRRLAADPKLKARLPQLERAVAEGTLSPALAVEDIVATLGL